MKSAVGGPRTILGPSRRVLTRLASRLPAPPSTPRRVPLVATRLRFASALASTLEQHRWALYLDGQARPQSEHVLAGGATTDVSDGTIRVDEYLGSVDAPEEMAAERVAASKQHAASTTARTPRIEAVELESRRLERGALTYDETARLGECLEHLVSASPGEGQLRAKLVAHWISLAEFQRAAAVPAPALVREQQSEYIRYAERLSRGEYRAAHEVRQTTAARVARTRPAWHDPLRVFVDWARAINLSSDASTALAMLDRHWPTFATAREHEVRRKLDADLRLTLGDPGAHVARRRRLPTCTPDAELRFDSLIRGRRVLVVGPAATCRPTEEEIAAADVIVTTRRHETAGLGAAGHPIVTYVADSSAQLDHASLIAALDSRSGDFFVARPSILKVPSDRRVSHDRMRIMQCEDGTTFRGTRFAIQRILYDLLAYSPASVHLTGVDFFVGAGGYFGGYCDAELALYAQHGLCRPDVNASHDVAADHRFTAGLLDDRLISAPTTIRNLLALTTPSYLHALERDGFTIGAEQAASSRTPTANHARIQPPTLDHARDRKNRLGSAAQLR